MYGKLKIKEDYFEDYILVRISGEIDIFTASDLKQKLYDIIDKNKLDLKLECSTLDYIDSTGLGVFAGAFKKTQEIGKKIYLIGLQSNIKKLFAITGLDKLFIIKE